MTSEEIEALAPSVVTVLRDALRSRRWEDPDYPGSAHLKELSDHLRNAEIYSNFRATATGAYFLWILEPLQEAMNDDWLPNEIFGLSLPKARAFIICAVNEIETQGLVHSVNKLRTEYLKLCKQS